ncbi:acyl-CoA dehydrogenase, short chain-specific (acdS) [Vulcanisaeta moutnovskia 768-28]|uniref:Acyl-CoA dehydrogenase, short chain-specific (AcdS) n=1 Tax=Vulcanisaeta moutnovskia (strain 768-28) TaxID=985053 RepID=F0QSQ7_VULM7|nr:acyl-CoA dehydrogenase family protein [Vulcanisaeta moutnovskia]ADY01574.1 acyl-CoA dehydrogenase, short chain-specific (acdS) [Vulcanisaeta moutnovskia 768-28]
MSFLDLDRLTNEDELIRRNIHRLAEEILRPLSIKVDRMEPRNRIALGSPLYDAIKEMKRMELHKIHLPKERGGLELTNLQRYIIDEELGWASLGFATLIGVDAIPFTIAALFGSERVRDELVKPWLEDTEGKYIGCWGVTEPEHGSDYILAFRDKDVGSFGRGNVVIEHDGDEWVINGQKSAWVSAAPICTHMGLHAQLKDGKSLRDGAFVIMPLNLRGVRKGEPVDMLGNRDCPQGPVYFDNVHVPDDYVIVQPPFYEVFSDQLLNLTSVNMGAYSVGLARAAFEEALRYAKTRVQGGKSLIEHKNIKLRMYEMFERVETARYYVRRAMDYVYTKFFIEQSFATPPRYARAAQIYAKKIAFEVAHDALQVFGAYGLSREFIIEKLFRDARALLIEDGTVETLSLDAADDIIQNYGL